MKETRRQIEMEDSWEGTDPLAAEEDAPEKRKWPSGEAAAVALQLVVALAPGCLPGRCVVAGSLRRRKAMVGDVEIVYVPRLNAGVAVDMFTPAAKVAATDAVLSELLGSGVLMKRKNVKGSEMWGERNKLAVHVASGIPVDLFGTTEAAFFNYLVCRTGGKDNNIAICNAARAKGWKWNPYGSGFSRGSGLGLQRHEVRSEAEVFAFVGLPYVEPEKRR